MSFLKDGYEVIQNAISQQLLQNLKIESIENRLLIFDASVPHHSTTCTDDKCRVNVNFNFF